MQLDVRCRETDSRKGLLDACYDREVQQHVSLTSEVS